MLWEWSEGELRESLELREKCCKNAEKMHETAERQLRERSEDLNQTAEIALDNSLSRAPVGPMPNNDDSHNNLLVL